VYQDWRNFVAYQRGGFDLMSGAILAGFIIGTTGGAGAGVYDYSEPGSGVQVIPVGALGVTIEVWGAGGGGGYGYIGFIAPGEPEVFPGGGGGGGGYSKTILSLSTADNKTINYIVGAGGPGGTAFAPNGEPGGFSNVSSGTSGTPFTITTMTANGGNGGDSGQFAQQGAGGTASGGNTTNTPGNGGALFTQAGATGISGVGSLTAGAGGNGGEFFDGEAGLAGRVRFVFTF
jgi:hypothetical protein